MSNAQFSPRASVVRVALIAIVAGLVSVAFVAPSRAAQQPCWQTVIADWSDGTIAGTYAISCYRQALQNMPEDVRIYSSASEDIARALAGRMHASRRTAVTSRGGGTKASARERITPLDDGDDRFGAPLIVGASLALLLAVLAAGAFVAGRRVRPARTP